MWICYVLYSLKNPGSTYVGITNDMIRRLRQHNGEISGGAKRTSKKRPWAILALFYWFPDKITALQFEWRVHHPPSSRMVKTPKGKIKYKYPTNRKGLDGRIKVLEEVLSLDRWTSNSPLAKTIPLSCLWYRTGYSLNYKTPCYQMLHPDLLTTNNVYNS